MHIRLFRTALLAAALLLLTGSGNAADARYDRRLTQAAAEIVAARMGPLRGGFAVDEEPALSLFIAPEATRQPAKAEPRPPAPGEWRNGLAIAVEKKSSVSPEL